MRPPVPFRRLLRVWDYLFGNATPAIPRRRLTVEGLEDRTMLTAVPPVGPDGGLWAKVDTLVIDVRGNQTPATGAGSSVVLDAGKTYLAVARGEARIANDPTGYADAEFIRYNKDTGPQDGSSSGLPWVNHGVRISGVGGGEATGNLWGGYQSDHQYVATVVGQGTKATGYYVDIPGYYGDNSGTLQVDLYAEVPTVTLSPDAAAYVEGSVATLDGTYDPAVSGPNPVVTVDWGDGTPPETLAAEQVAGGKFSAKHYYGDDRQPGDPVVAGTALVGGNFTAADKNTITVTVTGAAPAPAQSARAVVTISNAPPTRLDVVPKVPLPGQAAADGKVIILTTVSDPSNPPAALPADVPLPALDDAQPPHDLFRRTVDWGDGKPPEVVPYDVAVLSVHHDYNGVGELNPGEKARNAVKTITVTANDDDEPGKTVTATTTVKVRLEPPKLGVVTVQPTGRPVTEPISEGQRVTAGGSILRPGPAKWTSVLIDWGDKSEPTPAVVTTDAAGNVTYAAEHTYRDNGVPRPGGGFTPYTVTVVATADGFAAFPLTGTAKAAVGNVAPAGVAAGVNAFGPIEKRGVRIVGGVFADPGADTHTVVVDWGDNTAASVVSLAAGARGFDAAALAGLSHEYAADGDYTITVTVRDDDGGTGAAKLKFLSAAGDVLLKVYQSSKDGQKKGVLDTVIAFGNQVVDWVSARASAFTAAIDGFAGFVKDLPKLEAQLRTLFGTSLPQVLDAVLEKPATFVTNLFDAAADVFTDFKNNFGTTARELALQYLARKGGFGIAEADIPTGEEFANVLTNPAPVAGFVLKVLGVTWDDVVAKVAVAVGPDNLEALTQVYNLIAGAIGDGKAGQTALIDAFRFDRPDSPVNKLLEKLGDADLEGQIRTAVQAALDGKGVTDQAVNAAVGGVIQTLPGLIAGKVATLLAGPGLGAGFTAIKTLYGATTWLAGNINAVVDHAAGLVKVFADSAGAMITDGAAWQAAKPVVVAALAKAIKDIGPTVIDFAAAAAQVKGVAEAAGNAVKGLRTGIDKKLDAAFKPVAAAGAKLLDKGLPTGVGVRADYTGLVGNVVTWKTGTETHRLWSTVDSKGKATTWVASDKSEVGALLTELGKVWKDDPTLSKAVTDGKDAFSVVSKEVGDVATADKRVRADIAAIKALVPPAQPDPAFDRKQDALEKQLASDTKTRVTEADQVNTQVGTTAAPGQLPKSLEVLLAACFAAGTPLRTPWGAMSVEDIRVGDSVLSRSDLDPSGPVEPKVVEEVFRRLGRVWHLTVGGHLIRTTAEHPFYINGKGWAPCSGLLAGDRVLCEDGKWAEVEEVVDTGRLETVYNLRVADYHTYFVGCDEWGLAVWAHNLNCTNFDNVTPALSAAKCGIIANGAEKVLVEIEKEPTFRRYNVRAIVEGLLLKDNGKYFASPDTLIKHLKGILGEFRDVRGPELGKFVALIEAAKRASQNHRVAIEIISDPTVKGSADVIDVTAQEAMQIKHVTSKNDQNVADHVLSSVNQLLGRRGEVPPVGYKLIAWVIAANPANPWNSAKTSEDIATILDRDYVFNQSSPTFMNLTADQILRRDAIVIRIELANGSTLEVTYKDLKPGT